MKYDYTSKLVYIGIDVHKKTYMVVCRCDGEIVKKWTTKTDPVALAEQLNSCFTGAKIKTAYEAGFSGLVLHRVLEKAGINNIVVNPGSVEVASRDRVKTDKRDALKLATQLSNGGLKCIYIPSEKEELARTLTRTRASLVKDRTRKANQIKGLLYQFGYIPSTDDQKVSLRWVKELKEKDFAHELKICITTLADAWIETNNQIKALDAHLKEQAEEQPELEKIYRSVPGIGRLSSRELANELGDMRQFSNERKLFSYTGLTPSQHESGETSRYGHITRCGHGRTRCILVEVAWMAIRKDSALAEFFKRVSYRAGVKRAIVAVARKLIGRIRTCFLDGTLYEIGVEK